MMLHFRPLPKSALSEFIFPSWMTAFTSSKVYKVVVNYFLVDISAYADIMF